MKTCRLRTLCLKGLIKPQDYLKFKSIHREFKRKGFKAQSGFNLDQLLDKDCKTWFRFTKTQIRRLRTALHVPDVCVTVNRVSFSGLEGLCILLRRLCYPNRLYDLEKLFNRDATVISRISNWMTKFLYTQHGHKLRTLAQTWFQLEQFAEITMRAGCPYPNIIGFIDGTARGICRPIREQKQQYSGYKKTHVLKYQSVVTPNGLIARLDGPFNGRRHDSAILQLSNLLKDCEKDLKIGSRYFAMYGDPGYANQKFIKIGYKNTGGLTAAQQSFNRDMSALRVNVEYGFGKLVQLFAFLDFKKNQKVLLQPLKEQYLVAALLTNCHTCLNGSQVSDFFKCSPPSL